MGMVAAVDGVRGASPPQGGEFLRDGCHCYRIAIIRAEIPSGGVFPAVGAQQLFGQQEIAAKRFEHVLPGLATERAGIHGERAAQGAGNSGEEIRRSKSPLDALFGDARAGYAGFAIDNALRNTLQPVEHTVRQDGGATQSTVAN